MVKTRGPTFKQPNIKQKEKKKEKNPSPKRAKLSFLMDLFTNGLEMRRVVSFLQLTMLQRNL